jgi:predicted GNAT superfamily acetyltransferase
MNAGELRQSITIRDITDLAEMREVEELQKAIWGVADREVLPAMAMRPITAVGGVLIGAFDNSRMVGFVFGFPGLDESRLILHSDMLAVKAESRSQGIGYQLKLAQRERALEKRIDMITWTFDPLQAANAHLNFSRLGVISDRYFVNFYGETTSYLHRTGTDRLWVKWFLNSERVRDRAQERLKGTNVSNELDRSSILIRVAENEEPKVLHDGPTDKTAIIEVPGDISAILRDDCKVAVRWREATRHAFKVALDAGYVVEEFYLVQGEKRKVGRYVLRSNRGRAEV